MAPAPEVLTVERVINDCQIYIEQLEDILIRPTMHSSVMILSTLENIIDYCNNALEQLKDEEGKPLRSNDQIATMLELYECIWDVRKMFDMRNYIPVPVLSIQPI